MKIKPLLFMKAWHVQKLFSCGLAQHNHSIGLLIGHPKDILKAYSCFKIIFTIFRNSMKISASGATMSTQFVILCVLE